MKKYGNGLKVFMCVGLLLLSLECEVDYGYGQTSPQDNRRSNRVEPTMKCQESRTEKNANQVSLLAGLKLTMSAEFSELRKAQSAPISVRIENNSDERLGQSHGCFIELVKEIGDETEKERGTYSSLIALKDHLVLPSNLNRESVLDKGGELEINVDLTKLQWVHSISSSDIAHDIFKVIPRGYYHLRFVILIYNKNENGETFSKRVMSNEILVFVYSDL